MNDTQNDAAGESAADDPHHSDRLRVRLWPAVLILLIQAVVYALSITSGINNGVRFGFMMLGPAVGVLLFTGWLLFASRLPWKQRLLIAAMMIALPAGVSPLVHSSLKLGLLLYGSPLSMLLAVAVLMVTGEASVRRRFLTVGVGLVGLWSVFPLGRLDGFQGSYLPELDWRWSPTAEERLIGDSSALASDTEPDWQPDRAAWPGFRGPGRDGRAAWKGDRLEWSSEAPQERWRIPIGPGWSSFAHVSGRLFTQEQRGDDEAVSCYDAKSGSLIWMCTNQTRFTELVSGAGPRATPTFANGRLYAMGGTGLLLCLDPANGEVLWKHDLPAEMNAPVPMWGFSSSPLVANDRVIVHAGADGDDGLVAFDAQTGERAWGVASPSKGMSYSSAQKIRLQGQDLIVFGDSDGLFAIEPVDGEIAWRYRPVGWSGPAMCQPRKVDSNTLIVPLGDGVGLARVQVELDEQGKWQFREDWSNNRLKPSFNDFVIHREDVYGFDQNIFVSLNAATGQRNWKRGRYGFGQVVLLPETDQMIVVTEQEGDLVLLAADPERHIESGRIPALNGKTWNHPILVDGRLFVRNGEFAVCFEL